MDVSRRKFIGGAASLAALQGCRIFTDETGSCRGGTPRLKFGAISDIHVIAADVDKGFQGSNRFFERTLKWFDREGVDAVLIAGDMADAGLLSQLCCVGDAWRRVFPGDKSLLDGRKVEKLFIYGNHDWEGSRYNYTIHGEKSKDLRYDTIRLLGMARCWREAFDEDYSPIYVKNVKGYDFVGAHWDGEYGFGWEGSKKIEEFFRGKAGLFDPRRPFFYFQHPHPKDTCYGPWAWGRDDGSSTRALSPFPNAVAFSGHSHYSLVDNRSIWQGAFTSVGTGSLRYSGNPYNEFEKRGGVENIDDWSASDNGAKLMDTVPAPLARSGLLVSVYDGHVSFRRRDFNMGEDLGPDWVMPLDGLRPFEFKAQKSRAVAPRFAPGAAVALKEAKALPRDAKKIKDENEREKAAVDAIEVRFPEADDTFTRRTRTYTVRAVAADDGRELAFKRVLASAFNRPYGAAESEMCVPFAKSSLAGAGKVRFEVTAYNEFEMAGNTLVSDTLTLS